MNFNNVQTFILPLCNFFLYKWMIKEAANLYLQTMMQVEGDQFYRKIIDGKLEEIEEL